MALAQQGSNSICNVGSFMRDLQRQADSFRHIDHSGAAVGAALVRSGKAYYGFNSIGMNGMSDCHTHAEISAINKQESVLVDDEGESIMITTRFPCEYCAAHIVRNGITTLYAPPIREGSKWRSSQEIAMRIMGHVGVNINIIETAGVRG